MRRRGRRDALASASKTRDGMRLVNTRVARTTSAATKRPMRYEAIEPERHADPLPELVAEERGPAELPGDVTDDGPRPGDRVHLGDQLDGRLGDQPAVDAVGERALA